MPSLVAFGPSGGTGGNGYRAEPGPGQRIARLNCRAGDVVDRVMVAFEDPEGGRQKNSEFGGAGGELRQEILIPADDYIVRVWGRYGNLVDSLSVATAKGRIANFGGPGGAIGFHYEAPAGHEIGGFWGNAGARLDSIGVLVRPRA